MFEPFDERYNQIATQSTVASKTSGCWADVPLSVMAAALSG
jgi:hypothetical protein